MPRMRMQQIALVFAVVGTVSQSGCATVAPSARSEDSLPATTYSYSAGRGVQDFKAPPGSVKTAVFEAMDDLKMTVVHRGRDGAVSQVDGRTSDNQTVTVTIRPQQTNMRVSCRIGWFGDQPLSRSLLERVGIRLGTLPPAAIPDQPPSAPASNPIFSRDAVPDSQILRDFAEAPYRDRVDP
jgi:hypothetical protein